MKKVERKNKKKRKGKHTLYDFLPKDVIEEFIEYQNDPGYKEECERADEELNEKLTDLAEYVGRELTKKEISDIIGIAKKYSPKNKNGEITSFYTLLPFEHAWKIYKTEREDKWDLWEEFLK